jgi:hypothetical protein
VISCEQGESCTNANIGCPPDTPCELVCAGAAACDGATLFCDGGVCSVDCMGQDGPCDNANVECGENGCAANCEFGAGMPTVDCGNACECNPCLFQGGG